MVRVANAPCLRRVAGPQAGYATGFVGKWHHGPTTQQSDFDFVKSMPEKVEELRQVMLARRQSVQAPIPTEPNPTYEPPP